MKTTATRKYQTKKTPKHQKAKKSQSHTAKQYFKTESPT